MKNLPRCNRCGLSALLAVIALACTSCDSGPIVYPVKGQVVDKGKGPAKDLAGYTVQFESVSSTGETPGGPVNADGSFVMFTRVGGSVTPGVKEGSYRACLLQPVLEGGGTPPLLIPKRYLKYETSQLQYDIKPGKYDLTIEIDRSTR